LPTITTAGQFRFYKFKIGDTVFLKGSLNVPGAYVIIRQLPVRNGEFEYQIKECSGATRQGCSREPTERNTVARRKFGTALHDEKISPLRKFCEKFLDPRVFL
jgi:hypothetical protein